MSCFLHIDDEEASSKINIDELFERKQQRDLKQLSIFNKILARIQRRIQLTGRNKRLDQFIWFQIPEYIFGEPIYDKGDCIAYVVNKLTTNGFHVRYLHPNTVFVSWANWVPGYVRTEFKKKTGKIINEKGEISEGKKRDESVENEEDDFTMGLMNQSRMTNQIGDRDESENSKKEQRQFNTTTNYKPSGKFVYNPDVFDTIETRLQR